MNQLEKNANLIEVDSAYWKRDCDFPAESKGIAVLDGPVSNCYSDDIVLRTCLHAFSDQGVSQVNTQINDPSSAIQLEPDGTISCRVEAPWHNLMSSDQRSFRQSLDKRYNEGLPISVSELDQLANEVEQSLESALAKMQILVSSHRRTYSVQTEPQDLEQFNTESEFCQYSAKDALRLVANLPSNIRSPSYEPKFLMDGRGNIDVEFKVPGHQYEWKVMKSDLNWPMIRVLEYKKQIGTSIPPTKLQNEHKSVFCTRMLRCVDGAVGWENPRLHSLRWTVLYKPTEKSNSKEISERLD